MKQEERKREMLIITSGELDINLESIVNIPIEFAYKAHSDPLLIPKWWGPAKYKTTVEKMDFRTGGKWRFVQNDVEGNKHVFFGEYREIIPLKKITWTFRYEPYPDVSVETVEFIAINDKQTKLRTTSTYPSKETRDAILQSGMESGYRESMDRLEKIDFKKIDDQRNNNKKVSKKTKKSIKKKPSSENGKIILMMTMTLDGFLAGSNNELDWMSSALYSDPENNKDNLEILKSFEVGIMGYPTLAGMVPFWKHVAEDPKSSDDEKAIANIVNNYHAYTFSKKEETLPTEKAELIIVKNEADIIKAVKRIKAKNNKNIGVAGGVRTAQTFSKLGLIDEYILTIYPVVIGSGKPLFTAKTNLELISSKAYKNGIIRSIYKPTQNPTKKGY